MCCTWVKGCLSRSYIPLSGLEAEGLLLRTRCIGSVFGILSPWELAKPPRSTLNRLFNILIPLGQSDHFSKCSFKWLFFLAVDRNSFLTASSILRGFGSEPCVTGATYHSRKCCQISHWAVHSSKQLLPGFEEKAIEMNNSFICYVKIQFSKHWCRS